MDEKETKNKTSIPEGIIPPNCGSHTRGGFGSCERNLDDLYREKISDSIRNGFDSLSKSFVECALILSSEDYANSLIEERKEKKRKEEEEKKRKEEENQKRTDEFLKIFKLQLRNEVSTLSLSDEEKESVVRALLSNKFNKADYKPEFMNLDPNIVRKAFMNSMKILDPNSPLQFFDTSKNLPPFELMTLTMILNGITLPPLTCFYITDNNTEINKGKDKSEFGGVDPMAMMLMSKGKN